MLRKLTLIKVYSILHHGVPKEHILPDARGVFTSNLLQAYFLNVHIVS